MYSKKLFYDWVPKPLYLVLYFILFVVVMSVNAMYATNIGNMSSGMGFMPEYFVFSLYAVTIGTNLCFPFVIPIVFRFTTKQIMLTSLLGMAIMLYFIQQTESISTVIVCSLLFGIFKTFAMLELVVPLPYIINPSNHRGEYYSKFYPFVLGLSQIVNWIVADVSYSENWSVVYIISIIALLICVVIVVVFTHPFHPIAPSHFGTIDWKSGILYLSLFLSLAYILVFAKQQGWFASYYLYSACLVFCIVLTFFIFRLKFSKMTFWDVSTFRIKSVWFSFAFFMILGLYMACNTIQSAFTNVLLGYDNLSNSRINIAMIPGLFLAGFLGFIWFRKNWWLKTYIFIGFASYALYAMFMYFLISPQIHVQNLIIPTFLKGFGMAAVFIGISFYSLRDTNLTQLLTSVAVGGLFRGFIGVAFFSMLFAWALYYLQVEHFGDLAVDVDSLSLLGQSLGSRRLYAPMQLKSLANALKELYGYVAITGIGVLVFIVLHRFETDENLLVRKYKQLLTKNQTTETEKFEEEVEESISAL